MSRLAQNGLVLLAFGLTAAATVRAQTAPPVAAPAVAVTVNGYAIAETTVQRALERRPANQRADARPELLNYLVDNVLVEQYLVQQNVQVDKGEVDKRIEEMKAELTKQNRDLSKMLSDMKISEAELREQTAADLRWEKFATARATDTALKELFETNKVMFDGTTVRARHILLTPAGDAAAVQKAQAELLEIKQRIEAKVNAEMAKQPADADPLAREKVRVGLLDDAFAENATKVSACPSKTQGGDVGWFERLGFMVEPFARTAFALKPYQMSDVVQSQFGFHLILVTDRKAGIEVKFDDVKDDVREVFCERLRESILTQVKPRSRIVLTPTPVAAP